MPGVTLKQTCTSPSFTERRTATCCGYRVSHTDTDKSPNRTKYRKNLRKTKHVFLYNRKRENCTNFQRKNHYGCIQWSRHVFGILSHFPFSALCVSTLRLFSRFSQMYKISAIYSVNDSQETRKK